jgi:tetratricopeptide (TPR) repeat protein
MAFGFGFNKTKVLSAAERYIQQGKLQNAIAEYEKVVKADPKDLTVLNTIGDLYARIGRTDQAISFFRSVGDTYATQGFTVKAIAMYKKLTKLKPSLECTLRLADLYAQQGLQNDARAQYMLVADQLLRSGQTEQAVRVFQKVLDIDPENVPLQLRLAEVHVRLENKQEAIKILWRSVEVLKTRNAHKEVEAVVQKLLELDPSDAHALMARANAALEAGETGSAIKALQAIKNIDSLSDGLRLLARAYIAAGRTADAGTTAKKLLSQYQDHSALVMYADALMKSGEHEEALRTYHQFAEQLFAGKADQIIQNLNASIPLVEGNRVALELLRELYERAGDNVHLSEVTELLAEACKQAGDTDRARDLHLQVAAVEPQKPGATDEQYLGIGEAGSKIAGKSEDEPGPVVLDDLNTSAPPVEQKYPEALATELHQAITDADLYISYKSPEKAMPALVAVLPKAANDVPINQRLAALHVRAGRLEEAAECCRTLESAYAQAGHREYATKYGKLADRFDKQRSASVVTEPAEPVAAPAQEIDLSHEWEGSTGVTAEAAKAESHAPAKADAGELVQEIKFYIEHAMWEEAETGIAKCAAEFPNVPELTDLRALLAAKTSAKQRVTPEKPAPEKPVAKKPADTGALGDLAMALEDALPQEFAVPASPAPARAAAAAAGAQTAVMQAAVAAPAPAPVIAARQSPTPHLDTSDLSEIFSEFKEGLEENAGPSQDEDPETHYNLGVAFKEMGLMDEAIGELQKVCQAVERGQAFSNVMQAYTWLAQCFLEKGVHPAAIRWYEKALTIPNIDEEARTALHYELAAVYEASGNKQSALSHFMQVYGSNIDYRDVAERIKALKS